MPNTRCQSFLSSLKLKTAEKPYWVDGKAKFLIWILALKIWILLGIWFLKFKFKFF
jgi:hypothetical protein